MLGVSRTAPVTHKHNLFSVIQRFLSNSTEGHKRIGQRIARCLQNGLHKIAGLTLLTLVVVQIGLGISTWLVKYGMPYWATSLFGEWTFVNRAEDVMPSVLITSHVAVGSLILAVSLALSLRLARQLNIRWQDGRWVGLMATPIRIVGTAR